MYETILARKLKNQLLALDPTLTVEVKNVRVNHETMGCSGFVTSQAGKVVYVNTDHNHGTNRKALYRTAEHNKDYRGGMNQYAPYDEVALAVVALLHR